MWVVGYNGAMTPRLTGEEALRLTAQVEDSLHRRMLRAASALESAGIPYAVVGGQAVALWVAQRDPGAARVTKDVDLLLRRNDLERAKVALSAEGFVHAQVAGVDVFLDGPDGLPSKGVHLLFAGEKVRPFDLSLTPDVSESTWIEPLRVSDLEAVVRMKLTSFRDKDRTHLRDMIGVGLIDDGWLTKLPPPLAERLKTLLDNPDG